MVKIKAPVARDFSESAFKDAVAALEVFPGAVEILCSSMYSALLFEINKKYECRVVMVPDELLKNRFYWAVRTSGATYWAEGIE